MLGGGAPDVSSTVTDVLDDDEEDESPDKVWIVGIVASDCDTISPAACLGAGEVESFSNDLRLCTAPLVVAPPPLAVAPLGKPTGLVPFPAGDAAATFTVAGAAAGVAVVAVVAVVVAAGICYVVVKRLFAVAVSVRVALDYIR